MIVEVYHHDWHNFMGLLDYIQRLVTMESGDGWCWITCDHPETMSQKMYDFLKLQDYYDTPDLVLHHDEDIYCVDHNQEGWTFSTSGPKEHLKDYESWVTITDE